MNAWRIAVADRSSDLKLSMDRPMSIQARSMYEAVDAYRAHQGIDISVSLQIRPVNFAWHARWRVENGLLQPVA